MGVLLNAMAVVRVVMTAEAPDSGRSALSPSGRLTDYCAAECGWWYSPEDDDGWCDDWWVSCDEFASWEECW